MQVLFNHILLFTFCYCVSHLPNYMSSSLREVTVFTFITEVNIRLYIESRSTHIHWINEFHLFTQLTFFPFNDFLILAAFPSFPVWLLSSCSSHIFQMPALMLLRWPFFVNSTVHSLKSFFLQIACTRAPLVSRTRKKHNRESFRWI